MEHESQLSLSIAEFRKLKTSLEDAAFNARALPWGHHDVVRRHIDKALQQVRIVYSTLVSAKEEELKPPKLF